jgi:hypothetical protein
LFNAPLWFFRMSAMFASDEQRTALPLRPDQLVIGYPLTTVLVVPCAGATQPQAVGFSAAAAQYAVLTDRLSAIGALIIWPMMPRTLARMERQTFARRAGLGK